MKRFAGILLALLIAVSCAFADTTACSLSDLASQTSKGWHKTYEANGQTITVDIPIQVPDVEHISILAAEMCLSSKKVSERAPKR